MRKTFIIWVMMAAMLPLTACGSHKKIDNESYTQSDNYVKRNLDLKDFHGISNNLGVDIHYTQDSRYQVTAETTAENWDKYNISVEDGMLKIDRNKKYANQRSMNFKGSIILHITAPRLELLANNGSMIFHADHWKAGNLKFRNNGSMSITGYIDQANDVSISNNGSIGYKEGSIKANNLSISNNGSSTITVPLDVKGDIHISNNGSHKLISTIKAATYSESCNGSSTDQVDIVANDLKQSINGSGKLDIHFKGKNADIYGSGSVKIDMQLDCEKLTVKQNGTAKIKVAGTANNTSIKNEGVVKVDVSELNKF